MEFGRYNLNYSNFRILPFFLVFFFFFYYCFCSFNSRSRALCSFLLKIDVIHIIKLELREFLFSLFFPTELKSKAKELKIIVHTACSFAFLGQWGRLRSVNPLGAQQPPISCCPTHATIWLVNWVSYILLNDNTEVACWASECWALGG